MSAHTKFCCYTYTRNSSFESAIEQHKLTIVNNAVDLSQLSEIVGDTFDGSRHLFFAKTEQGIFFYHFGENSHFRHFPDFIKTGATCIECFSLHSRDFQIGIESRKHIANQRLETIEHRKHND